MKSIALFNASYEHEQERSLWSSLYQEFNEKGYEVFEFQCRVVPVNSRAAQYIFPARLRDFGKIIRLGDFDSPTWFTVEELEFSVLWEKRRWELDEKSRDEIERGAIRLAQAIELFFLTHRPELVIVYNEIDHPQRLAILAAQAYGVPLKIMERSPFMGVWLEDFGLFDKSRAFRDQLPNSDPAESRSLIRMLSEQIEGFREGQFKTKAAVDRYVRPIVFLALDNFLWTAHIEGTLARYQAHYHPISDVQAVIDRLSKLCNDMEGQLVVKPHPSCKEAERLTYPQGSTFYTGNLPDLLRSADVVVGWNSKVLFNALALEKPVICLGPNPVRATNACYSIERLDDIESLLIDALHHVGLADRLDNFSRKLPSLVQLQYFDIDMSARHSLGAPFSSMVKELLQATRSGELASRPCMAAWYSLADGKAFDWKTEAKDLVTSKEIRVLFEASRLLDEKVYHSGISRYIRKLIARIGSSEGIYFTVACWEDGHWTYYAGDPLLSEHEYDIFHSPHEPLRAVKARRRLMTIHDVVHLKIKSYYPIKSVSYKAFHIYKALESLKSQDHVICDSHATKRDLLSFNLVNPNHVSVVYLGVEKNELFDTGHQIGRGQNVFVLYQHDTRKNSAIYFEIATLLQNNAPGWRIIMVAADSVKNEISKELEERGCDNVEVFLSPSDEEKGALMNQCAFSVFLPLYEGFGLPLLESLVTGLPVIASSTSSLQELASAGVRYVSPFSLPDIEQAVLEWVKDPEAIPASAVFQDDTARLFSWDRTVTDTVAEYYRIAEQAQVRNAVDKHGFSFQSVVGALVGGVITWHFSNAVFGFAISLFLSGSVFLFVLLVFYMTEHNLLRRFREFLRDV
jgi:glycosyltransferase involved in cell wall biosynthesis